MGNLSRVGILNGVSNKKRKEKNMYAQRRIFLLDLLFSLPKMREVETFSLQNFSCVQLSDKSFSFLIPFLSFLYNFSFSLVLPALSHTFHSFHFDSSHLRLME